MLKKILIFGFCFSILALILAGLGVAYGYYYYSRDLPNFSSIDEYNPSSVTSIYSNDETLIAESFDERRYPVKLEEVPLIVRNAFVAAEDSSFYTHPGIDLVSIFRAFIKNIQTGKASQGASTITQQVIKNILLGNEKKLERKIKEAILAYRLEGKLSKDEILELYLNQIYFGNGAYGIKAASEIYFHTKIKDISIAQASLLAGLPKAPSRYSPLTNYSGAKKRQNYVLGQMKRANFISEEEFKKAKQEKIEVFKNNLKKFYIAPYYVSEVKRRFLDKFKDYDIERDGLEIHTALDIKAYNFSESALKKGLEEVDKRRGWRGPIKALGSNNFLDNFQNEYKSISKEDVEFGKIYPAVIKSILPSSKKAIISLGNFENELNLSKINWAKKLIKPDEKVIWIKPHKILKVGDVIEVSFKENKKTPEILKAVLDQTPKIQGATVLLDPHSGKVISVVGGYDFEKKQINLATQGQRQPGSAFKPFVYFTAVNEFKYTPATRVVDEPKSFRVGDDIWSPLNYDKDYLGPLTLQSALEKSRNTISADLIHKIGVDPVIRTAKKMGIKSELGRNLSLSLGSSEVNPLELTRAYGVFPARGVLFDSIFITKVKDNKGKVIYDYESEKLLNAKRVVSEDSAFVMSHMMRGVVQRGTGWRIKDLKRPAAGKTGTSNEVMDAWFVGFTPEYAAGVWVGFDEKKIKIGDKETGGSVASPIWLNFMKNFLDYRDKLNYEKLVEATLQESEKLGIAFKEPKPLKPLDFTVTEGVTPYWIDKGYGHIVDKDTQYAILSYFLKGTKPEKEMTHEEEVDYWNSMDL